jgi:hypothetical protein
MTMIIERNGRDSRRPARYGNPLVALLLVLAAGQGCGSSSAPTAGPELFQHTALQEVGDMIRLAILDTNKPPASLADLARYQVGMPTGFQELKGDKIVLFWSSTPSDASAGTVLAYEKGTPQSGGFVLMQDGKTIKKMTPEEFKAAPKAGTPK